MPTYVYHCRDCAKRWEKIQRIGDSPVRKCPHCKRMTAERLICPAGIVFKGTGFPGNDMKREREKA